MTRNQNRDLQVVDVIKNNPGIKFREIMRSTGMKNGVLSHYVTKLERTGTVQVIRGPRETRFYPLHISAEESKVIRALRRQTPRDIIYTLLVNDKLSFSEIVKNVNKSPSTVSLYLSQVVEDEIVDTNMINRKKIYQIKEKLVVDRLIEQYQPNMLEKASSSFEDTINSL